MELTRRDILCAMAAVGALVASPGSAQAAQAAGPTRQTGGIDPVPRFVATRDGFARHVDQVFRVLRAGQMPYGLGLVAVHDGAAAQAAGTVGSQHCFTPVFVGPASNPLDERTYEEASPDGLVVSLFLKRGQVLGDLRYYEAPFNGLPLD